MRLLAAALALALTASLPASAASFAFSFDNGGQGPVGVVMRGLPDDGTGPATSVSVTVNDGGGYGIGEYLSVTSQATNSFTLGDGQIIGAAFKSLGSNNTLPAVTCCTLAFGFDSATNIFTAGLSNQANDFDPPQIDDIVFIPIDDLPAPVPLPAPLLMLASAVAALGCLGLRRPPSVPA